MIERNVCAVCGKHGEVEMTCTSKNGEEYYYELVCGLCKPIVEYVETDSE